MEIMDIGEGEEELVVGIGKVANVERAKLHGSRSKKLSLGVRAEEQQQRLRSLCSRRVR